MRIQLIVLLLFISISLYGASDSYINNDLFGVIHFSSLVFLLGFSLINNYKIEKTKDEISGVRGDLIQMRPILSALEITLEKINKTLETIQSEKMIYASKNQIQNIIKTNIDLCEMKILNYSVNLKHSISSQIIDNNNEQKEKFKQSISNMVKMEKNTILTNIKPFKYSEVEIDDMLNMIFDTNILTQILFNFLISDKDVTTHKIEINSFFNDIVNKFTL
jgi:hypothetical protein